MSVKPIEVDEDKVVFKVALNVDIQEIAQYMSHEDAVNAISTILDTVCSSEVDSTVFVMVIDHFIETLRGFDSEVRMDLNEIVTENVQRFRDEYNS